MAAFYTGRGDDGTTSASGSARVGKGSDIITAIGDTDELNSAIGVAIANMADERLAKMLQSVQNDLFIVGSELSSNPKSRITAQKVKELERGIEELSSSLPPLRRFVLPSGTIAATYLHLSRAICRRAERAIIRAEQEAKPSGELKSYMNRLSSFLFVAALYINNKEGVEETNPSY